MADAGAATSSRSRPASGSSFFQLYKRGQGYYTRMGTAIGAGILAAGAFNFVFNNLNFDQDWVPGQYLKIGIPALILIGLAVLVWWLVGVHRRTCDFMIATEGEMKKVNWSSKKEIIASTKVVIVVTLMMAAILFLVDLAFMNFFSFINVLRTGGSS